MDKLKLKMHLYEQRLQQLSENSELASETSGSAIDCGSSDSSSEVEEPSTTHADHRRTLLKNKKAVKIDLKTGLSVIEEEEWLPPINRSRPEVSVDEEEPSPEKISLKERQ